MKVGITPIRFLNIVMILAILCIATIQDIASELDICFGSGIEESKL